MHISVEEAITLIRDSSKYDHSLLVSRIMNSLAKHFNKSEEIWKIVGLLHDLDYDRVDDFSKHGIIAAEELENKLPVEAIHAIQSHDYRTGVKPETLLDKALIFADSLAGFIESKADLNLEASVFKEKPWLWENLIEFTDKHELNVLEIIAQLTI
jgi:putative nucleotidyltransferase with HDIG domain